MKLSLLQNCTKNVNQCFVPELATAFEKNELRLHAESLLKSNI